MRIRGEAYRLWRRVSKKDKESWKDLYKTRHSDPKVYKKGLRLLKKTGASRQAESPLSAHFQDCRRRTISAAACSTPVCNNSPNIFRRRCRRRPGYFTSASFSSGIAPFRQRLRSISRIKRRYHHPGCFGTVLFPSRVHSLRARIGSTTSTRGCCHNLRCFGPGFSLFDVRRLRAHAFGTFQFQ